MDDFIGQTVLLESEMRAPINLDTQRELGAFYTCPNTAEHMANWAIRSWGMRVLEPSFGSGIFLRAARRVAKNKFNNDITLIGAELSPEEHDRAKASVLTGRDELYRGDFLTMPPTKVDAVIGNPPYVRLRHLPKAQAKTAHATASRVLGQNMETSGSVWMPFVLRCQELLTRGGRMALVLPFELTYVKYARPLWGSLANHFSKLTVVRVRERLFPDLLQDVVILYAEGFGGHTEEVEFYLHEKISDFLSGVDVAPANISVAALIRGERQFIRAHLDPQLRALLDGKLHQSTDILSRYCTFNIGYVSGHKSFFHPDVETQVKWRLPERSMIDALVSGRSMKNGGLLTSQLKSSSVGKLFFPKSNRLAKTEESYIQHGEDQSVHLRYKCQVRSPWYVVPGVRTSDLIMSVFADRPILMKNDADLVATNSLLNGFMKPGQDCDSFVASWYSSLTLLGCEMQVHSLGGGVLVLIPGEVAKIRIPQPMKPCADHLRRINTALQQGDLAAAYEIGDEYILRDVMGLSNAEVDLIRDGVARLAHWRLGSSVG